MNKMMDNIQKEKELIRKKIWDLLTEKNIAIFPLPCHGRIPNFKGVNKTAKLLENLKIFKNSNWILVSPDSPQKPIRELVLKYNKNLIMPSPRLKSGFLLIKAPPSMAKFASSLSNALKFSEKIEKIPHIDLAIIGSVAVDLKGNRLGKGGGYGDREIKLAKNFGAKIISNIHSLQIVSHSRRFFCCVNGAISLSNK